jgi:hypothetical protein
MSDALPRTEDDFINAIKNIKEKGNIEFDSYENIKIIDKDYIDKVIKYGENGNVSYYTALISNMVYNIQKMIYIFTDNILYHIGKVATYDYPYYIIFLNVFFILFLFVIGFILYWDNVYRTAAKSSRCTKITEIVNDNIPIEYPFMYSVIIIHESDMDDLLEKFALRINFDFLKKTTTVVFGDDDYLVDATVPYSGQNETPFAYYDLNDMKEGILDRLDAEVLAGIKYQYIPVTPDNRRLYTDAAKQLAEFVKEYGRNHNKTPVYPIYNILNAAEQHNMNKY